jgi:hypothetical protein
MTATIRAKIAASSQFPTGQCKMVACYQDDVIDIKVSTALRITAANEVRRFVDRRLDNNGLTSEGWQ